MASSPAPLLNISQPLVANLVGKINAQSGTTYTLVLSDSGQPVSMNNGSAQTLTIPPHSSVAMEKGAFVIVIALGAGQLTIAAGAGVTLSSSAQGTGSQTVGGQNGIVVLRQTNTTDTWIASGDLTPTSNVLDRDSSLLDINNTSSKTTVYSFTLLANKLGTNKTCRVVLGGEWINNTAATHTLIFELKIGSTVVWSATSAAETQTTTAHPWWAEFDFTNVNAANVQAITGWFAWGVSTAPTTGLGSTATFPTAATAAATPIEGTAAEDTTTNLTITLAVTLSATANAALGIKRRKALAYLLGEGQKGDTGAVGPTGTGASSLPENPLGGRTSTSDTPLSTDYGCETTLSNASAITCTIPSTSYLTAGQIAFYRQIGAGAVTFVAGGGVTLDGTSLVTRAQFAVVAVRCISTTHYVLVGDTA